MERSGINLNEIDTTDCHNSLESLQLLAHRLYKQDPSKIQQWQQEFILLCFFLFFFFVGAIEFDFVFFFFQAQSTAQGNVRERTIASHLKNFPI
jgi:hypothetical protein